MILIFSENGMRLCQDNKWRSNADYGTYSECVKEYKILSAARKKAKKVKGLVVEVPLAHEIDRTGVIFDGEKQRKWQEFTV
jgi:hypothetical protein